MPIYKAIDAALLGGSATTTSTVVVNDGAQDYTVTINNLWDDPGDVTYETTNDIDNILFTLTNNPDGTAPVTIKSVDFSTNLSAQRNEARPVSVEVPGGLKIGANDVTVKLAQYGVADLQTAHVTLTLPVGTALGNVDAPTTVSLYARRAGATKRTLLAVVPVRMTADGTGLFTYTRKNLTRSTRFTAIWDGDNDHLGATAAALVRVK